MSAVQPIDDFGTVPPRAIRSRARLLVVDDEQGMRDLLNLELEDAGYEVETVGDANGALAHLRRADVDIVISDVRMPGMDGIALLDTIRSMDLDTEVIMATAFATMDTAIDALRRGAFDFVQKPFEVDSLLATVARAVERRSMRSAAQLSRASHAIFTNKDPQRLPELIVDMAMKVLDADDVSLMLLDSDDQLYVAYSQGLSKHLTDDVRVPIGTRVAGRVALTREPLLLVDGIGRDSRFADVADFGRVKSSIVYPLATSDRLIGVLNVSRVTNDRPFQQRDLDRAAVVASQVLLALENVRLVRQMVSNDRLVAIGQLAAGVAHEINNPLAAIVFNHDLLRDGVEAVKEDAIGREVLERIPEVDGIISDLALCTARIVDIVRDLSSLARNDEGARTSVLDLGEAVQAALRITAIKTRGSLSLQTKIEPGLLVRGIPGRLSQVFVNLLVNASQALMQVDAERRNLEVVVRRDGDQIVAEVRDTGPGISAAHLARIFEPFFTTKAAGVGTGLGLAICRDIVNGCDGELSATSVVGEGACFTVSLPAVNG